LAHSRQLLKAAFAEQLKDRSPTARRALADALMDESDKPSYGPADRVALLTAAIEAAKEGGSLGQCFQAAEKLSQAFLVDSLRVKLNAATGMSLLEPAAPDTSENVLAGLDLVASLEGAEDFTDAFRLLGSLRAAGSRDPDLRRLVAARTQSLESARSASERIRPSLEKLKSSPSDTAANLAVGSYYCLRLRQWDKGLPFLAKGSASKMGELAAAELSTAAEAGKAVEIADRWWEYSEAKGMPAGDAKAIKLHAASLYERGRGTVTGLGAKMAEARLKQAAQIGSEDDESGEMWTVLFRSSDPSLWNTNTDDGPDRFAVDLGHCPSDVRFLKLTAVEQNKSVIIPITSSQIGRQNQLCKPKSGETFVWQGSNEKSWGGRHLGISKGDDKAGTQSGISITGTGGSLYFGWGFGHKINVNGKQYYSWNGEEIDPTVFEISVKAGPLTFAEGKMLLK